eukprot:13474943-Ditylum_brightwellii.AAC.1
MTFKSHLNTLESWDYLLLKDLVLEISAYKIAQICQTDACINISSNSSFIKEEYLMTFGWIIVNNDKENLAEHAGPAFGQATSFGVEGYGILESDWGIVAQVADTLKEYNYLITIKHVKSHHNDNTLFDKLTMPARLNVAANSLATNYSIQHCTQCVEVPRMEINYVQLCTTN